jgi:hypothetical protein|tara:strand:+ start:160 stop:681 length:522 start_codon:yes stop_codon:yes gene_type:complete
MKLLSIIVAVLISISAYSQDFIEYNDFTFSHNGEEIQMEDIEKLTKRYGVGKYNLRKAKKWLRLSQKSNLGFISNSLNLLGGAATGSLSLGGLLLGEDFLTDDGGSFLEFYNPTIGVALIALGAASGSTAIYLFSNIGNRQDFEHGANNQFKKVADKINQARLDERPSAELSN